METFQVLHVPATFNYDAIFIKKARVFPLLMDSKQRISYRRYFMHNSLFQE